MELYIIIGILLIVGVFVLVSYNKLVKQRNMTENQKSQIDIQLQRRFDLIPNLVEVVKGYASHEKSTLEAVVQARNNYDSAGRDTQSALAADGELNQALSRLFVIVEAYPELLANKSFLNLQNELSETEKKIAFSRQFYNDSVTKLNNLIDMFPSSIVASLFGFKKERYFETTDSQRQNVSIDL